MEEHESLIHYLLVCVFTILAAIAGSLNKMEKAKLAGKPYVLYEFWVGMFLSLFTGVFFAWVAQIYFDNYLIIGLFGAVGGFLGIKFLEKAAEAFGDIIISIIGKKSL